ncbi:unnamed protein product [Adineta ricciae]|uniref:Zinc metalloproteinase n=1 Tax=Adineta ricciae TaxID=249248 RepID=A0A815S2Q8_ADIRI|nr:unnamed protein product [Adineta ricciae]
MISSVNYVPLLQNPPLNLCILVGCDSPLTFDDTPDCQYPPNLDTAIKKLRLAGYLWQAYTASQIFSNGFGHRTFRLDESYQRDTLSGEDQSQRQTAMIHVLKSKYTTAQIRHPSRAQQNLNGKNKNILFDIALEAIRSEFQEERNYVAVLLLDSHYEDNLITGHATLGSGSIDAQYSVGIFGSHNLFSWPATLEDVIPCFTNERDVDTKHCGIDAEGDKYWIACNVGLGAVLHEIGHALGCPYEQNGVMMRDYIRLNRSFCVVEPPGPPALDGYGILLKSTNGILAIEFYLEHDKVAKSWIDYLENPPAEVILWKEELRSRVNGEVHSGLALDGLEFFTKEHSVLFGKRGGSPHDFPMENGEFIQGFGVQSGVWIDAVQIITNKKRSEWFGDIAGGSEYKLTIPDHGDYRLRAVAIHFGAIARNCEILPQLRAIASQFFAITGHSAIAVAPQLRRNLTAIANMGWVLSLELYSRSSISLWRI